MYSPGKDKFIFDYLLVWRNIPKYTIQLNCQSRRSQSLDRYLTSLHGGVLITQKVDSDIDYHLNVDSEHKGPSYLSCGAIPLSQH